MKYKLKRGTNPETHAFGDMIFVEDENGDELKVAFSNEYQAFDYIKMQVENDATYSDLINNPDEHIMELYNALDDFDKGLVQKNLVEKYRYECMYKYFR